LNPAPLVHIDASACAAHAQQKLPAVVSAANLRLHAAQAIDLCRPMTRAQQEQLDVTSVWPSVILRGAQLIFAALIVAALASTVTFARIPPGEVVPPVEVLASQGAFPPLESFAVITQRNLFRSKGGGPRAAVSISGMLPRTSLEIELLGTLVAGEGRRWYSLAIVKDAKNLVVAVREGQTFAAGRIRVASIEPRRIVIENAGVLEVLALASEREEQTLQPQPPGLAAGAPGPGRPATDAFALESMRALGTPR
jgi:hypothetical protein